MSISQILNELRTSGNYRALGSYDVCGGNITYDHRDYINLSSNDYLGLSERLDLQREFFETLDDKFVMSNPSSRLMCGNSRDYDALEASLANFMESETSLVLGSGYLLNSSLPRAIATESTVFLADKLIHASLTDGLLLCGRPFERFRHNDVEHLEKLLQKHNGQQVTVLIESLYSMNGDMAPLAEISALKTQYGFDLVVDEAHAFGVFGKDGKGLTHNVLDAEYRVITLGKAAASTGAAVFCTCERKELLVNKLKSVIFSTALPPINLRWSQFIVERMASFDAEREHLQGLIKIAGASSQIFPVMAGSNDKALAISDMLRERGFWATAIRHPTVPRGTERVRISLTAAHKTSEIERLCGLIG